jgi:hypothetical protein
MSQSEARFDYSEGKLQPFVSHKSKIFNDLGGCRTSHLVVHYSPIESLLFKQVEPTSNIKVK